ncbi:A/G-specific adenine glycosylase [Glacieibacterium frigidum]|uniref:Adenine DNA glycosylase n=1 Tax=Glacieibacterium frigidum TaxID=2593303 RepID=A0A552UIT6_9SPHN|nr:A/G-specific adenine glycosylase [Glacieibacterium frigidum]TRW18133.1 A/G-specific adenine glycosylase [Glacieibacterium frigidum]
MPVDAFARELLDWYDAYARTLPWRGPPGTPPPDPYRVWLSEVMLQQTTVAAVAPHFERFVTRWPTVADLAAAPDADVMQAWAGLGYYARARNLLACARVVAASGWPRDEAGLRELPGVGAYTAAAIASIAFGQVAVVVDGNVERVMARLFAVETPIPAARPLLRAHAATLAPAHRPGDYAQALMDLGATVCTPRNPRCDACPVSLWCAARTTGDPARYPIRAAKIPRPIRHGTAFRLEVDGHILLVRRPPRGLLGGMRALPSTEWSTEPSDWHAAAPVAVDWRPVPGEVRHVFTHFELRLRVMTATLPARPAVPGEWWPVETLGAAGLPTLFAKALRG